MSMNCLWFDLGFWMCMCEQMRNLLISPKRAALA